MVTLKPITEDEAMAREIAADKHVDGSGYYNEQMREVFISGWDAAMEYVRERSVPNQE